MYGAKITVPAPVEVYDGVHAEMKRQSSHFVDGCLVHIGLVTPYGFEVLEVWDSKQHYDRANAEIVVPLAQKLADDQPAPPDLANHRSLRGPRACHPTRGHPDQIRNQPNSGVDEYP